MRRPVWRPRLSTRVLTSLWKRVRQQVTLKRAVSLLLLFTLGGYFYTEDYVNSIVIEPFSVPKSYQDAALTPEVMSRLIADALVDFEEQSHSRMGHDRFALSSDLSSVPDVDISTSGTEERSEERAKRSCPIRECDCSSKSTSASAIR